MKTRVFSNRCKASSLGLSKEIVLLCEGLGTNGEVTESPKRVNRGGSWNNNGKFKGHAAQSLAALIVSNRPSFLSLPIPA